MNGGDWVPFHRRLVKGRKRSIPRGVRFVLLELSLEGRLTRGVIDLPLDRTTLNAVHDLLGGNRREIRKALDIFSISDETGIKTIEIVRQTDRHQLVLVKWEQWAGPKSTSDRVREHRENKRLVVLETLHHETAVTPTDSTDSTNSTDKRESSEPPRGEPKSHTRLKSVPPPPPDPPESVEPEEPAPLESGYELARRIWCELWRGKYRRDYEFSTRTGPGSEDVLLQSVGGKALIRKDRAEAFLRHKIGAYLKDHGRNGFLDEKCHPLRNIEHDWVSYGDLPPPRMAPRRTQEPEVPAITAEQIGAFAKLAANIGKIGR